MKIDLFDLIEGLFEGIVLFIYNLVYSIGTLIFHPVRGPLILYRRYIFPRRRQMSSLTLLFCLYLSFFFTMFALIDNVNLPEELDRFLASGEANVSAVWPAFVLALIATVLVDAPLRLFVSLILPKRRLRRDLIRSATEYGLLLPILTLPILALTFVWFNNQDIAPILIVPVAFIAVLLASAAAMPAARIAAVGMNLPERGSREASRKERADTLEFFGFAIAIAALSIGAPLAAIQLGFSVVFERTRPPSPPALMPLQIACRRTGNSIEIEALVSNPGDEPVLFGRGDFYAEFRTPAARGSARQDAIGFLTYGDRLATVLAGKRIGRVGPWRMGILPSELTSSVDECRMGSTMFEGFWSPWSAIEPEGVRDL